MRSSRALAAAAIVIAMTVTPVEAPAQPNAPTVGMLFVKKSKVFVRGQYVPSRRWLYKGDSVRTSARGEARLTLKLKSSTCNARGRRNRGEMRLIVRPRERVLVRITRGTIFCGSRKLKGDVMIDTVAGTARARDPVFGVTVASGQTTVKVTRGAVVVAGARGVRVGVVLGAMQQTSFPQGADPADPRRAVLSPADRAAASDVAVGLPPVTDVTKPTVKLDATPPDPVARGFARFQFSASEPNVTFACSFDGGRFHPCMSPVSRDFAVGRRTFAVMGVDLVGNVGPVTTYRWTVRPSRIAFATGRDGNAELYAMTPDGARQQRLTIDAGSDTTPVWSPDGDRLAFMSTRGGNTDIYVMPAGGGRADRITTHDGVDSNPAWSPDGAWLAFESTRDGGRRELYVVPSVGGEARRITFDAADDSDPAWSPDGSRIVFASDRSGSGDLYVIQAEGGRPMQLTDAAGPEGNPAWSQRGGIAFHSYRDGQYDLYAIGADGRNEVRVTRTPEREQNPAWAPDGTSLAFQGEADGGDDIYVVNRDGTGLQRLSWSLSGDIVPDWGWAPNGEPRAPSDIAFVSARDGNPEIYTMNADGTLQTRVTIDPGDDLAPAWSPDRRRIAFHTTRSGGSDVYLMNADGSAPQQVTTSPEYERNPDWSPDGMRLVYESGLRDGARDLWIADSAGAARGALVTGPADDFDPAWSADGGTIAFASQRDGDYDVFTIAAGGGTPTNVSRASGADFGPAWSRGGDLMFHSSRDGDFDIWVLNRGAREAAPLTVNDLEEANPSSSPDGSRVAFQTNRDGEPEIYSMTRNGASPMRLTFSTSGDITPDW